jgi:hypothetical protein
MRAQRSSVLPVSTTISRNRNGEHIEFVDELVLVANSLRNFTMFAATVEMSSYKIVILAHSIPRYPLSTLQHVREFLFGDFMSSGRFQMKYALFIQDRYVNA